MAFDIKEIFLVCIIILSVFFTVSSCKNLYEKNISSVNFTNIENISAVQINNTINNSPVYYEIQHNIPKELEEINNLAKNNLINKTYKLHHYDCTQFSEDLVRTLRSKGYKAQCTAGNMWAFDYTNHTWVSVWVNNTRYEIEATDGTIIEDWVYKEYYEVWKEDYCW